MLTVLVLVTWPMGFVKPKLGEDQKNIIMNSSYTISLSFSVGQNYKRDDKIGFFGVPGKNFGVSYDYVKKLFVFVYFQNFEYHKINYLPKLINFLLSLIFIIT